jgi:hypothetical protein
MKLGIEARKLFLDDRWSPYILLVFMVVFYGVILFNAGLHLPTTPTARTFNSMLDHLAQGQFDVDPKIIGDEGFLRNGHVYTYFGITCALLRLPLLLLHRLDLDVTAWSCLVAVCLAGFMKVRTVFFLKRYCGSTPGAEFAFALMLVSIVLGGAGIGYLRSSLFQEVIFWAIAFAAVFVYFAVKGIVSGRFTVATLSWMALAAGLALLTRVSTGTGLYAAIGLLLVVLAIKEHRLSHSVLRLRFLVPVAILAAFVIVVGAVNYGRWGKPTTFADFSLYLFNSRYPDRMPRTSLYGLFNWTRIPFGLCYYFVPIWALQGADGRLLFESTQYRLMDSVELPPSSFFLTDLLPIAFIVLLVMAFWTARSVLSSNLATEWDRRGAGETAVAGAASPLFAEGLALAIGLAVPCIQMLMAISMCYRYRMEFYPEIDLLAFMGLYVTVSNPALLARFSRHRRWFLAATVVTVLSASAAMILSKISGSGPSQEYLRGGVLHYYEHQIFSILRHGR